MDETSYRDVQVSLDEPLHQGLGVISVTNQHLGTWQGISPL